MNSPGFHAGWTWEGQDWRIVLERGELEQLLHLTDPDDDQAVVRLDAEDAERLSAALRGRRFRRSTGTLPLKHAGMEVHFRGDRVNLVALVDPTRTHAELHEQHGALALLSAVNGLATREGLRAGVGQLPAGVQVADLWIPRHVARALSVALTGA